ncbi:MAG: SiaB family protein kinase [Crocinitomicaceae bacterium]|nr:SiaB family protein kinase [Crocinitomicaceae bacterium]
MDSFELDLILKEDDFSMIYRGEFNDEMTYELMELLNSGINDKKWVRKRLSYLVAECFQNVIRHADTENSDKPDPILITRKKKGNHFITSINLVENSEIEKLNEMLSALNKLDDSNIDEAFHEALQKNQMSEKGGAGLGLIEMARKTKNPLQHEFLPYSDDESIFVLQLKMTSPDQEPITMSIQESMDVYNEIISRNIVLLRKGNFKQESLMPVFNLFEANLAYNDEDLKIRKKGLYILIEMLQNIARHGKTTGEEHEGIFILSIDNNEKYSIETGNSVDREHGVSLERDLTELAGFDKIQLNKRYKHQLMSENPQAGEGAGIGIIEMFRNCDGNVQFNFESLPNDALFFSIKVLLN